MTSTPAHRSGRLALWLHLIAIGIVLTVFIALLVPPVLMHSIDTGAGGTPGSGQVNSGGTARHGNDPPDGSRPANPATQVADLSEQARLVGTGSPVVSASPAPSGGGPRADTGNGADGESSGNAGNGRNAGNGTNGRGNTANDRGDAGQRPPKPGHGHHAINPAQTGAAGSAGSAGGGAANDGSTGPTEPPSGDGHKSPKQHSTA